MVNASLSYPSSAGKYVKNKFHFFFLGKEGLFLGAVSEKNLML